ncbi:MAG TPA: hypothetical protein VKB24_01985, partial [Candidatus Acidoferrum sp.]|nr:hypothetical protein [Candidatus Acidoferrum sp.]
HWFEPVMNTFVRALPQAFAEVEAAEGTTVKLRLSGALDKEWQLLRNHGKWRLGEGSAGRSDAEVEVAAENAWKIFTKGISGVAARRCVRIRGNPDLGEKVLETVAVLA